MHEATSSTLSTETSFSFKVLQSLTALVASLTTVGISLIASENLLALISSTSSTPVWINLVMSWMHSPILSTLFDSSTAWYWEAQSAISFWASWTKVGKSWMTAAQFLAWMSLTNSWATGIVVKMSLMHEATSSTLLTSVFSNLFITSVNAKNSLWPSALTHERLLKSHLYEFGQHVFRSSQHEAFS